jgi:hypothetical protein
VVTVRLDDWDPSHPAPGVNRGDYRITWNAPLEAGGLLVSKDITISIDIETVLKSPDSGN